VCWLLAGRAGCIALEVMWYWMFRYACIKLCMVMLGPALFSLHVCFSVLALPVDDWFTHGYLRP
jgi:hypothetical protein